MKLLEQYQKSDIIRVNAPLIIDHHFLKEFIGEYSIMLAELDRLGSSFLEEPKLLEIVLDIGRGDKELTEDFDFVFLSYLTLMRTDFPNLEISIHFPDYSSNPYLEKFYFQLDQHRLHLLVHAQQEIYKLYLNGAQSLSYTVKQSASYFPPVIINDRTVSSLFKRRDVKKYFGKALSSIFSAVDMTYPENKTRKTIRKSIREKYIKKIGSVKKWTTSELSGLYLLEALFDLYILRHVINTGLGRTSTYQIGSTIKDKESARFFRESIYKIIVDENVLSFSDIENYLFSILVQNNKVFEVPVGSTEMLTELAPILTDKEILDLLDNTKLLYQRYTIIYGENLKRTIRYVRDLAYGLEELAKNIVEHTSTGTGMITGRIFSHERLNKLKSVEPEWSIRFNNFYHFFDINVVDVGRSSIKTAYWRNLEAEKELLKGQLEKGAEISDKFIGDIMDEYEADIAEIRGFGLANFFNFDSITLFHQINRTKARLGLLIFAQTVIKENNGFVSIASNDLMEECPLGYSLYSGRNGVSPRRVDDFLELGTNYNFVVPINERMEELTKIEHPRHQENSMSSSVFLELHEYGMQTGKIKIKTVHFPVKKSHKLGKYEKLDRLRREMDFPGNNELILIDAAELDGILTNSSDWIRFLANIQFGPVYVDQIVIQNFSAILYEEIINILKIFDNITIKDLGFWKQDRFALIFVPLEHEGRRFWFNSLLGAKRYEDFLKINQEINMYHHNLYRVFEENNIPPSKSNECPLLNGKLFSKSGKLLNFELIIHSENGLTLFEETVQSLLNIKITDNLDEDKEG